jgi:four helix bundle protein
MPGAKRVEDLDAHKLAVQLRRAVFRLTSKGRVSSDYKFVDQIRNSARGGPRNIAEGHGRFVPGENVRFLSYAKASLEETLEHIDDAEENSYFDADECLELRTLTKRALGAVRGLMRYLESPEAQIAYKAIRQERRATPYVPKSRTEEPSNLELSTLEPSNLETSEPGPEPETLEPKPRTSKRRPSNRRTNELQNPRTQNPRT